MSLTGCSVYPLHLIPLTPATDDHSVCVVSTLLPIIRIHSCAVYVWRRNRGGGADSRILSPSLRGVDGGCPRASVGHNPQYLNTSILPSAPTPVTSTLRLIISFSLSLSLSFFFFFFFFFFDSQPPPLPHTPCQSC